MGASSSFPIDLILFGMIAAFLVLRLRSILGRRTGFERPGAAPISPVGPERRRPGDRRPRRAALPTATRTLPEPTSAIGQTLDACSRSTAASIRPHSSMARRRRSASSSPRSPPVIATTLQGLLSDDT